jgi:hypothetical protein
MATATLTAGLKAMAIRENERPKVTAQDYGDTVQCACTCANRGLDGSHTQLLTPCFGKAAGMTTESD